MPDIDPTKPLTIRTHWDQYTVYPGIIDNEAIGAFTTGQCHALALEIHERTGWELCGFFGYYEDDDSPGHVGVCTPEGYVVDVQGIGAEVRWKGKKIKPVSEEDVSNFVYYAKPQREAARLFVDAVLSQVEEQKRTNKFPTVRPQV
jgi:hypothetical protein